MKVIPDQYEKPPTITLDPGVIIINEQHYHQTLIIDENWNISTTACTSLQQWITDEKCKASIQLITYPNATTPTPEEIDLFWKKDIGVDILPLSTVIQQAICYKFHQQAFQLIIFHSKPALI